MIGSTADAARVLDRAAIDAGEVDVARPLAVGAPEVHRVASRPLSLRAMLGGCTLLGAAAQTAEMLLSRRESLLKAADFGFGRLDVRWQRQRRSERTLSLSLCQAI